MLNISLHALRVLAALLVVVFPTAALPAQSPRIIVGPNVLVSHDDGVAHAELHVAAHPTDPMRLVGMATTVRDAGSKVTTELYASDDGGFTWRSSLPAHLLDKGAGDPITGFGAHGTAFGVALGDRGMWVYRSEDGGFTWDNGIRAGTGDHERLGVDYGTGPYAGRMYLAAEVSAGRPANPDSMLRAVHLWRSQDDGRTWIGPIQVARQATHGPGCPPFKTPTTPVFATCSRTSSPSSRNRAATSFAVSTSRSPSSGCSWMW